jgi:putative ABC transport system permease protein
MDSLAQDIRFAVRTLTKSPMFTTLAILCLAVGIGVNVNVYSAVYAAFLRPFEFADSRQLTVISDRHEQRGWEADVFSFETFKDLRAQADVFSDVAGMSFRSITLTDGEEPVRLQGELISWNLFPMLGVQPHIGRTFRADDDVPGAPGVVMIGYDVWERRYAADSAIIGRALIVNGHPHVLVGVMPKGFMFPEREEAWIPMTPALEGRPRDLREVALIARMKDGVDVGAATTQLSAISRRLETQYPKIYEHWRAYAIPLREEFVPSDTRLVIATMMGAVSFVLLIACANVANLLLARASTRGREIAVRTALGASRGRILRQLLTESIILALVACPIGIGIAFWLLDLVLASIPPNDMPYYIKFAIDGPVLLYAVLVAAATGIVFGLAPAWQAAHANLQSALKEGGRGSGMGAAKHRLRSTLVVGEVALSLVLLVGASLFVRSFLNVQNRSGGVETSNVMTMRFYMPGQRYDSGGAINARVLDIVERVEALPGVVSATASNQIPLSGGGGWGAIEIEGKPVASRNEAPEVGWTGVTANWFSTLGVPITAGRSFSAQEGRDSSRVAVVNETMARRFWPDESAIGKRFRSLEDSTEHWFSVIGVARDFRAEELDNNAPVEPSYYVAYRYLPARNTGLMIRTEQDPVQITSAVRRSLREADPTLPIFEVMSFEELRRFGFWSVRLFGWMFSMFAGVALVLASVGVYGVIAYSVSQRTQEIGVRVALGAQASDVIRMVVRGGATLAIVGIVIGLAGAFAVTRVIQSLLFDVSATDTVSFVGVTVFLAAVALLASYVPARRATKVDPMTALRTE